MQSWHKEEDSCCRFDMLCYQTKESTTFRRIFKLALCVLNLNIFTRIVPVAMKFSRGEMTRCANKEAKTY
ncbi:hypothetical protein HZS_2818 [Henneguya salminicola]|nr:hypothetical protein HZS_2818 [Henneguya salminicola]